MNIQRYIPLVIMSCMIAAGIFVVTRVPLTPVEPRLASLVEEMGGSWVNQPAENISLNYPESAASETLESYRGQWVFLNFWASWCGPCREEMPSMRVLADRLSERGFSMVAVSLDSDIQAMRSFLDEVDIDGSYLDIYHDPTGETAHAYGSELLPETWVISPKGRIVARFQGGLDWSTERALTFFDLLLHGGWRG